MKYYMEADGWTTRRLAEAADVSRNAILSYRQGKTRPRAVELYKVARTMGVSMEDLIAGEVE